MDLVRSCEEVMSIEDKWNQYKTFGIELMPKTYLEKDHGKLKGGGIFKRRLSSRARGIVWSINDITDPEDWIVQEYQSIQEELRVYIIRGEALQRAAVRSSKTKNSKVAVLELRDLLPEEISFTKQVSNKIPRLDFVGIDIIRTANGLKLLEINRSPDFAAYSRLSGGNLARNLYESTLVR
jgi:glutathione synthase/RimK-type ligase-like ATP-grasp enzyme